MGKGEGGIVVALDEIRAALPFALQTIDSDNGQDVCELCLMLCAPPGGVYGFQLCGYLPLYRGDARSRPLKSEVTLGQTAGLITGGRANEQSCELGKQRPTWIG